MRCGIGHLARDMVTSTSASASLAECQLRHPQQPRKGTVTWLRRSSTSRVANAPANATLTMIKLPFQPRSGHPSVTSTTSQVVIRTNDACSGLLTFAAVAPAPAADDIDTQRDHHDRQPVERRGHSPRMGMAMTAVIAGHRAANAAPLDAPRMLTALPYSTYETIAVRCTSAWRAIAPGDASRRLAPARKT